MWRIYIKEEVCIGCHLCEVYCQLQHSPRKDLVKAFNREAVKPLPRLWVEARNPVSFSVRCQHCAEPPCVYSCLTGAIRKDSDTGLVVLNEEKCIGCWTCTLVCPFGAVIRDTQRHKVVKCHLCQEEEVPACVLNCPNEALVLVEAKDSDERVPL